MKTVLQWGEGAEAVDLLNLTADLLLRRCKKHGWRVITGHGTVLNCASPHWYRFPLLADLIAEDPGGLTVWLDCDALWWGDEDLAEASWTEQIGMTPWKDVCNSGAIYLRNGAAALEWATRCAERGRGADPLDRLEVDRVATQEAQRVGLGILAAKWNSWPGCSASLEWPPVVRAMHGMRHKIEGMKVLLETAD
jgi:hypothetical protein